jgi:hypothetical protein
MKKKWMMWLFFLVACQPGNPSKETSNNPVPPQEYTPLATITQWQHNQTSNQSICQEGVVTKLLEDDNQGSRHQRFIVKLENNTTLLIAHNIDISTRITDLENGEKIVFKGEYEWNAKGGVVHWTHHDPAGKHSGGYLMYKGKKYD